MKRATGETPQTLLGEEEAAKFDGKEVVDAAATSARNDVNDDFFLNSLLEMPLGDEEDEMVCRGWDDLEADNLFSLYDEEQLPEEPQGEAYPPRFALDYETLSESDNAYLSFVQQPPREVRTRKKKEKRPFGFMVLVKALPPQARTASISCRLVFADDHTPVPEEPDCTQTIQVSAAGVEVAFMGLGIVNPCLKYKDREFAILVEMDAIPQASRLLTRKIYSYSNLGVLQRRREVEVVALSAKTGLVSGGTRMHLVGKPFFKSDRLKVVFRIYNTATKKWHTLEAQNVEFYSESVLFFDSPKVPASLMNGRMTVTAFVQVTNDGTNFSNGCEYVFRPASNPTMSNKRLRSDDVHQARL